MKYPFVKEIKPEELETHEQRVNVFTTFTLSCSEAHPVGKFFLVAVPEEANITAHDIVNIETTIKMEKDYHERAMSFQKHISLTVEKMRAKTNGFIPDYMIQFIEDLEELYTKKEKD